MAAPGLLPTKYVNGVPLPTSRKTLRMREKYIILLVFVTFGTVCFGAFVYLPDFRDGVRVDTLRGHLQNVGDVMVTQPTTLYGKLIYDSRFNVR
jgi:mannosyl-oligosaccharide alpha-1,2-mannosidase